MAVQFSESAYQVYSVMIIIMLFVGLTSQITALFVFTRKKFRHRNLNKLFINLVVADLVMIVWEFPLVLTSAFHREWVFGRTTCVVTGVLVGVTNIAMIITLVCIESKILHLMTITSPNSLSRLLGSARDNKLVLLTWVYSGISMTPPLVGWSEVTLEPGGINCAPKWTATTPKDIAYLVLLTLLAFVLPVSSQIQSFVRLWKNFSLRVGVEGTSSRVVMRNRAVYRSKARMVMASTFMFTLLWFPYCICSLITLSGKIYLIENDSALIPSLIAKCSAIFSPIVYCIVSRRFRTDFTSVLFCGFACPAKQQPQFLTRNRRVVIATRCRAPDTIFNDCVPKI